MVNMWTLEERREYQQELNRYAKLCNDEYGETLFLLSNLLQRYDIIVLDDTKASIEREIKWHIANLKQNSEIVEKVEITEYKYEELIWKDTK